jgi:hypothetical protein
MADQAKELRMQAKIDEVKTDFNGSIVALLAEVNAQRLRGEGTVTPTPIIERTNLRWTLAWKEKEKVSFDLNVVVGIEDDGTQAKVGRVWVQRHASTALDYEDHTPTTRMRRLAILSLDDIRDAIEQEMR